MDSNFLYFTKFILEKKSDENSSGDGVSEFKSGFSHFEKFFHSSHLKKR